MARSIPGVLDTRAPGLEIQANRKGKGRKEKKKERKKGKRRKEVEETRDEEEIKRSKSTLDKELEKKSNRLNKVRQGRLDRSATK